MSNRPLFALALLGVAAGVFSAYHYGRPQLAQAPVFEPAANPYAKGIYANGILETVGTSGANVNLYPEVAGPITRILIAEGAAVHKGDVLLTLDDSVQRATAEQLEAQAAAARALAEELKAEPRPETLQVVTAQARLAEAAQRTARDQEAKQERAYLLDPKAVSRDALDNARNARRNADANVAVAARQLALTKAGAWRYDIENQERQYEALSKASAAARALLDKYTLRAPVDGTVLAVQAAIGSYVSSQGAYDTYTGQFTPLIVMGPVQETLQVRAYVDEVLIHELADPGRIAATMFVRGTRLRLPLRFERIQPYVSRKIELSDARNERVDVRVLPVIFRVEKPKTLALYPGQLVDVYIGEK